MPFHTEEDKEKRFLRKQQRLTKQDIQLKRRVERQEQRSSLQESLASKKAKLRELQAKSRQMRRERLKSRVNISAKRKSQISKILKGSPKKKSRKQDQFTFGSAKKDYKLFSNKRVKF